MEKADRLQRCELVGSDLGDFSPGKSFPVAQWVRTQALGAWVIGMPKSPQGQARAGRLQSKTVPTSCASLGVPSSGDMWQVSAHRRCHGRLAEADLKEPCVTQLCHRVPFLPRQNSPLLDGGP